jgi:RNA polymerase sigma-70 factor (ECF subfamily)
MASNPASDERELNRRFRAGDPAAAEAVCLRHGVALFAVARALGAGIPESEDLVQETFLRALRYRRAVDPDRPLRPWLTTMLRRLWQGRARREAELDPRRHAQPLARGPEADARQHELVSRLLAVLAPMPAKKREAVVLRVLAGMTHGEIAAELAVPLGTVGYWLHEGLDAVRSALAPEAPRPVRGPRHG